MTPEQARSHLGHIRSLYRAGVLNAHHSTISFFNLGFLASREDWYTDVAHKKLRLELESPTADTRTT